MSLFAKKWFGLNSTDFLQLKKMAGRVQLQVKDKISLFTFTLRTVMCKILLGCKKSSTTFLCFLFNVKVPHLTPMHTVLPVSGRGVHEPVGEGCLKFLSGQTSNFLVRLLISSGSILTIFISIRLMMVSYGTLIDGELG